MNQEQKRVCCNRILFSFENLMLLRVVMKTTKQHQNVARAYRLLELLLGANVVGVATLALAAVGCLRVQTSVAPGKEKNC